MFSGNKNSLETLLASMQRLAEDVTEPGIQRIAYQFLGRCVTAWAQLPTTVNGNAQPHTQGLPGFERFVYERLIPASFGVLSSPQFNIKDGQMLVVRGQRRLVDPICELTAHWTGVP